MDSRGFLREKFREYYKNNPVTGPPSIGRREFGIGDFGLKIARRHLSFQTAVELNNFLVTEAPPYISYSNAYYEKPAARPMDAKLLEKADLIYEFDADDLKTACKEAHDSWKCKCGASGKGAVEKCSKCGNSVSVEQWICEECLGAVKKQVFRLLEFIERDFGLVDGLAINFSGSKGYHIHVRSPAIHNLSSRARIELVDYITANDLSPARLGFYADKQHRYHCPKPGSSYGWGKKIIDGIVGLLNENNAEKLAVAGSIRTAASQQLLNERNKIISAIGTGILYQLPGRKTEKFWNSVVNHVAEELGLRIDRQTSIDIKKIVRVPDTLHGGTGLAAREFPLGELEKFSPLEDSVVFSGKPVKVNVGKTPEFQLVGEKWGPFNNEEVELPEHVAIYLLARGSANANGL